MSSPDHISKMLDAVERGVQLPEDDDHPASPILWLARTLWIHAVTKPIIFGAMFYGYVTIIGLIYNVAYFGQFGITPFEFYDTQDFLLAGLRTPVILALPPALTLLGFLVGVSLMALDRLDRRWRRRIAGRLSSQAAEQRLSRWQRLFLRYHAFSEAFSARTKTWVDPYVIPFSIVYFLAGSLVMVAVLAINAAHSERPVYCATLTGVGRLDSPLVYIGATQSVYFFQSRTNDTEVIQRKDVVRLTQLWGYRNHCADPPAVSSHPC